MDWIGFETVKNIVEIIIGFIDIKKNSEVLLIRFKSFTQIKIFVLVCGQKSVFVLI